MAGTFSDLLFHIVFSTKDRIALIDDTLQEDLYKYIGGIVRGQKGILIEIGGMSDHIHLLVRLKPTHCIADFVREVKSGSSKWVNEEKWKLRKFGWQDGYGRFHREPIASAEGCCVHSRAARPSSADRFQDRVHRVVDQARGRI
jgi:REP element-mobilizing transposase RayT